MKRGALAVVVGLVLLGAAAIGARFLKPPFLGLGKQPDGSFRVATGQRVEGDSLAFNTRPIDLALHPDGKTFAVLGKSTVRLGTRTGIDAKSAIALPNRANAGFRGLVWSPDGNRLFASTDKGFVQELRYQGGRLRLERQHQVADDPGRGGRNAKNPVPGGMTITRDGKRLFVAAANRNAVVEIDLAENRRRREYPVHNLPYEPRLTEDETTLVVSNWGGRLPMPGDKTAKSQALDIVVDERGVPASGTVSIVDRASGKTDHVVVGLHPMALVVVGGKAYVANAMSDSISVLDIAGRTLERTIPLTWQGQKLLGSMPNALALAGDTLYACNGGDNSLCEIDLASSAVRGHRHAGFFPVAVALTPDAKTAFVLNTKGNGSVARTALGRPGNAHDFQGTVSVVDLTRDLALETAVVARDNRWNESPSKSSLAVYNGAIKHVVYIIKENRTYDEIFGDLPQGNGDPKLCSLGERVMPNHRALARQFTLFDNAYVSGTNSADGHAWCTQCIANDYLEHFYVGYSRTYPYDGDCAMALAASGCLWDAAAKKGLSIRVWGEFCDDRLARIEPKPKDWFAVWEDRKAGGKKFKFITDTAVASLKPYINPEVHCWPLLMSDQYRADVFIREYEEFVRQDKVPNLMILSLPCDHGEGTDPRYPTPRAMMADNDLALGRIVEAITKSPHWEHTCVFVIEDDAQAGPDHVDGHRTCYLAISPFAKRKFVDSTLYVQPNMFKSMELMWGMAPLNKFDALAYPMSNCFADVPDLAGYTCRPNNIPLDERNPSGMALTELDRYWLDKTRSLDWGRIDGPDPYWLNRINWYSIYKGTRPYPDRPGEAPGVRDRDGDGDGD